MTPNPSDIAGLVAKLVGDQPLPWTLWTSNSFRRIGCDATGCDGDVLHAYNQRSDNHPDLSMSEERLAALVAIVNTLPGLLERIEKLVAERDEAREDRDRFERNRDMWKGQCERQAEALTAAHDLANRRHGLLLTAEQALEAAQAKVGRYEAARSLLNRFLMSLTGGGKNRENVLSIDHDALVALVKDARKALAEGGGS